MVQRAVDIAETFSPFSEHWSPKVVARLGVEHCPVAEGEVQAMLVEPAAVVNTGGTVGPLTAAHEDTLS